MSQLTTMRDLLGAPLLLLLSLLLLSLLSPSEAVKGTYTATSQRTFGQLVQRSFGMAEGGVISLDYKLSAARPEDPFSAYFLLLLLTENEREYWYPMLDTVNEAYDVSLCNKPSWRRILVSEAHPQGKCNMTVTRETGSEQFSLAVVLCKPAWPDNNPVTLSVDYLMKNPRPTTPVADKTNFDVHFLGDYSHLGINDVMVERFYGGSIIIYVLFVVGLAAMIFHSRSNAAPIHYLFLATAVAYLILSINQYNSFSYFNAHGSSNEANILSVRIFVAIVDTLSLCSLFLLSLGWTTLRRTLTEREVRVVGYSILAYFLFAIGSASCLEGENVVCNSLDLVSFILKSLLLLAIIIAMNFTVTQLRAMLNHSPWVPSTPLQYARCKQYQWFRIIFILYLLLPTAFLLVQVTMYSWREDWVVVVSNEILNMLFLFHIGTTFGPLKESLLLRAFNGSLQRRED